MLQLVLVSIAVFGSLVCALLAIFAWRRRPAPGAIFLSGALACVAVYAFGYGLELSSSTLENMLACIRLEYLGVAWLPGFWLALSLRYTNRLQWMKPGRFVLLWIIPLIVLFGVFTNPYFSLHYKSVSMDTSGPFNVLHFERGPFYWLHMGYTFFSFLASAFLLVQYILSPHKLYRNQSGLMLLSSVLTILITTLYLAGLQPIRGLDIIVYALIISSVIVGWGLLRFHLIALSPMARDVLFDNLDDAVFVQDGNGKLVDYNPKARALLGLNGNPIGSSLQETIPRNLLPVFTNLDSAPARSEFTVELPERRFYEIRRTTLPGVSGEKEGKLVVVHEITQLKQMHIALEELNADLDARVTQRTQEYLHTIQRLEEEIDIRQKAEKRLQELRDSLVEQVSTQSRKLYTLYDVLLYKENADEIGEVLTQILERIRQLMGADAVCIHEAHDNTVYLMGSVGMPDDAVAALQVLPGSWLEEGKPFVSSDLAREERLPESLRLAMYTAYLAAPIRLNESITGVLQVFWQDAHAILVEDISYFSIIAEQIGIILENSRLHKILEERAVQGERRRLARDLHDSVTQSLHGLSLYVDILRNRLGQGQPEKAEEMLARLDQSARQALKEMRLLLFELRLAPLEDIRLVEALQNRLEAVEQRAGIDARLRVGETALWPLKWEAEMYCIAMEALNNSLKHSNASRIEVDLAGEAGWAEMRIRDNGRGFIPETAGKSGIGLQSMRERAERLGGQLLIESKDGAGTSISLAIGRHILQSPGD